MIIKFIYEKQLIHTSKKKYNHITLSFGQVLIGSN